MWRSCVRLLIFNKQPIKRNSKRNSRGVEIEYVVPGNDISRIARPRRNVAVTISSTSSCRVLAPPPIAQALIMKNTVRVQPKTQEAKMLQGKKKRETLIDSRLCCLIQYVEARFLLSSEVLRLCRRTTHSYQPYNPQLLGYTASFSQLSRLVLSSQITDTQSSHFSSHERPCQSTGK